MTGYQEAWAENDRETIHYYTGLIEKFGIGFKALNWGSRQSQQLRFAVLSGIGQLQGASILDVGCGQGDFFEWLALQGVKVQYTGIDLTPRMVEIASQRFPAETFQVGDVFQLSFPPVQAYDYVFASGLFTHRRFDPFDYLKSTARVLFGLCRKGVAFNSLSGWASEREENEFHPDPLETLAYCRTITPCVVLRHDYHPRDFSVYMYNGRAFT